MHGQSGLRPMGGLRRLLPVTSTVTLVGAVAISGLPPFAGFFSKDQILAAANASGGPVVWVLALVAAFFSAVYIARLVALAFFGARRSETAVHESPPVMTVPLAVLALLAAAGGLLGLSATHGVLPVFLAPALGEVAEPAHGLPEPVLAAISVVVALAGVAAAWRAFGRAREGVPGELPGSLAQLQGFLREGSYLDRAYARLLARPATAAAAIAAAAVDRGTIDRAVDGLGGLVGNLAAVGRRVQTGFARTYALAILLGGVALLLYVGVRVG